MNKEDVNAAAAEEPAANRFTVDAQDRAARLRAIAEEFPDDADPRTLTVAELRLASATSIQALENAARLVEAAPQLAVHADVAVIREMIAFELAYGGVRDQAKAVARRMDRFILRRKLVVAKMVRVLYRVAKGYVTADEGDAVRPHVEELGRALAPRRRKPAPPPDEEVAKK
jgi:hypothetical protein